MKIITLMWLCMGMLATGFWLGSHAPKQGYAPSFTSLPAVLPWLIQNADPRELLPLPAPGQPQPGQSVIPEECPLFFFQDGQFFQFGENPFGEGGGGSPELFPLDPVPNPLPGQPMPAPSPFEPSFSYLPEIGVHV